MITYPIAKINLGLNVVERRPDGYHNLQTVFYPVPLKDRLEVEEAEAGISVATEPDCQLTIAGMKIQGDTQQNLVVKAYRLLKTDFPMLPRVKVHLKKDIPTQAGMGGGSSDCAYMLKLLNELFHLQLSDEQLMQYAARLGADCAFFIRPVPCYAEGIGELLHPIPLKLDGWYLAIVRPDIPVSTKEAFSCIRPAYPARCCREVVMQPVETWTQLLTNDFEESVFTLHPEIGVIKANLYAMGATYAAMSGSGSALFGLFKEHPDHLSQAFPGMFTFCCQL